MATRGEHQRTFRFLSGVPIVATSTLPEEDFTSTMVACGLLDQARLDWFETPASMSPRSRGWSVQAPSADPMSTTTTRRHPHLIAARSPGPTASSLGPRLRDIGDKVERSLLPSIQTIEALIAGVLSGFEIAALHTFVDAADAGDLLPDARLTGLKPPAWLPDDMGQLHTHLGQSLSRSEIAEALNLSTDRIAAMLWLLEATGWAKRANPPAALIPLGTIAVIQSGSSAEARVPITSPSRSESAPAVRAPKPSQSASPSPDCDVCCTRDAKTKPASGVPPHHHRGPSAPSTRMSRSHERPASIRRRGSRAP